MGSISRLLIIRNVSKCELIQARQALCFTSVGDGHQDGPRDDPDG
jgi:hypothetical protein